MIEEKRFTKERFKHFLKKYGYILVAVTLLLIMSIIVGVSVTKPKVSDNNYKEPVSTQTVEFYLPLLDSTLTKGYSNKKLQWNKTLKQWEPHMAIDLLTNGNDNVYCALDGVVSKVYETHLDGKIIEVEHANNLITKYKSLDSTANLQVGDSVSKGQVIGSAGTCSGEAYLGNHLHFEVLEDGVKVDPTGYLNLGNK